MAYKDEVASGIVGSMGIFGGRNPISGGQAIPIPANDMSIRGPIALMVNKLAAIDSTLKARLDQVKAMSSRSVLQAREDAVEAAGPTGANDNDLQADAEKETKKSDAARIAAVAGIAGLVALQFEPVQEAVKGIFSFAKDTISFLSSGFSIISDGLEFFLGGSTTETATPSAVSAPTTPIPTAPEVDTPDAIPVAPTQAEMDMGPTMSQPTGSNAVRNTFLGAGLGAILGGRRRVVGAVLGGTLGYLSSRSGSSAAPVYTTPTADIATESENVITASHPDTGSGYTVRGQTDASGRPIVFSKEGALAFEQMMMDSGGIVKGSDITSSQRSRAKNDLLPGAATNSRHLTGTAMDIHGPSKEWIKQNGSKYGWNIHEYKGSHGGHFLYGGGTVPSSEGSEGGFMGSLGDIASGVGRAAARIAAAASGDYTSRGLTESLNQGGDMASAITAAEIAKNNAIADSNQKPSSSPTILPNINAENGPAPVQNVPQWSDITSTDHYLIRFGIDSPRPVAA